MNKRRIFDIISICLIFIITILYSMYGYLLSVDDMWCYGFIYNIINGLIPYVDYNMVIGPVFPYLGSIFLFLFGKNMLSFIIYGAVIATGIFWLSKKIYKRSYLIFYAIFLLYSVTNYNVLCMFFLFLVMYLEDKKANDCVIGIILGLTILTKIHVGLFLCIPSLFLRDKNKVFYRVAGAGATGLIALLIMLLIGNMDGFFNYTILGLFDFADNNTAFYSWGYLVIVILIVGLYMIIFRKDKDIKLKYVLCFLILGYPIFNTYHTVLAIAPALRYYLNKIRLNHSILVGAFVLWVIYFGYNNFPKNNMIFDKESKFYSYKIIDKYNSTKMKNTFNFIYNNSKNKDIYIFSAMAYLYKLEKDIPINKFDLINMGNMGYKGDEVYISEIYENCHGNCMFFLFPNKNGQESKKISSFIIDKYKYYYSDELFDVYEG